MAGQGTGAGLEGQRRHGLYGVRVVDGTQDLGAARPGRGLVDGDVEALVPEVHRAQEGLLAQVAAAAVAGVPQYEPGQRALPGSPRRQRGAHAHPDHAHLGRAPGPQQVHGGPHRPLPGLRPVRVAGPAGRITGAVVVDLDDGEALGRQPLGQGPVGPPRPLRLQPERGTKYDPGVRGPPFGHVSPAEQRASRRTEPQCARFQDLILPVRGHLPAQRWGSAMFARPIWRRSTALTTISAIFDAKRAERRRFFFWAPRPATKTWCNAKNRLVRNRG